LKIELFVIAGLLFSLLGTVSCQPGRDFNAQLSSIVKPYRFSFAGWEFRALWHEARESIFSREKEIDDAAGKVSEYFSYVERIKSLKQEIEMVKRGDKEGDIASLEAELSRLEAQKLALESTVEGIISEQIKEILRQQGIYNPLEKYLKLKFSFPPVDFKLDKPPHLLVVSPRDRIESMREITLRQEMSLKEMERIEAAVDELGVSSLVVGLGGFGGTYPAFVSNEASLRFAVDTAAEEWLHQYLAFKPLGFFYLLDLTGLRRDYEIATMNETVASMVSKEIGDLVVASYYPESKKEAGQSGEKTLGFDFNREMREIRKKVDELLARGEVEQAEEFMEKERQRLEAKGYYIRKLNQAYFAFYGTYADRPTSISPIGFELKQLRSQSASLKEFLEKVAAMTSREDLIRSLNEAEGESSEGNIPDQTL